MKKILSRIHRAARLVFISGVVITAVMISVSAVLYFGAGILFEYYSSVDISEKLLALSRPFFIGVCSVALCLEYFFRHKRPN